MPSRYLDSDVIIRLMENDPDYAVVVERLMEDAAAGLWTPVVNAVTLVEVTRSPNHPVDLARFARIQAFFDQSFLEVSEISIELALEARDLIYNHPWLYPIDALHLATAIANHCEIYYTFDRELIR